MLRIEQAEPIIASLLKQYHDHGIARWVTFEKATDAFIGWTGMKFITEEENHRSHFYDVGYRLIPAFWGKGYATESARFAIDYGFRSFDMPFIVGTVNKQNLASKRALEKCGLTFVEEFYWQDILCDWMELSQEAWKANQP